MQAARKTDTEKRESERVEGTRCCLSKQLQRPQSLASRTHSFPVIPPAICTKARQKTTASSSGIAPWLVHVVVSLPKRIHY